MKLILIMLLLIFALFILKYAGMRRFLFFLVGVIFLPYIVVIPAPFLPSYRLLVIAFLFSVILRWKSFVRCICNFPCLWILLVVYASHVMTGIMDHRLALANGLWKSNMAFMDTFAMVFVGYFSLYKNVQLRYLNKWLIILSLIIVAYGLFSGIIGFDLYSNILGKAFGGESDFTPLRSFSRTRLTSFMFNSHLFGFLCAILFTTILLFNIKHILKKKLVIVTLFFLLLGVIFSGSRSSFVGLFVGVSIVFLLTGNLKRIMQYAFFVAILTTITISIPATREKLQSITDSFRVEGGTTEGSNIAMRKRQLEISLLLCKQNPLWGNGFDYFGEMLQPDKKLINKEGLLGAESYLFILLIESGLVQIISISLFFISVGIFFLYNRKNFPLYAVWGCSILMEFLIISLITGNSSKWQFAFPFVGMAMRAICNSKHNLCP